MSVWNGTHEEVGPDHGVDRISDHPTGLEGYDIIDGFVHDAEGFDMFKDGEAYLITVDVHLDTTIRHTTNRRKFTYRPGMFAEA